MDAAKGALDTIGAAAPVTMARYIELSTKFDADPAGMTADEQTSWDAITQNSCWILDADGWVYWSLPLAPGTATNLLLDEVKLSGENHVDYKEEHKWRYSGADKGRGDS